MILVPTLQVVAGAVVLLLAVRLGTGSVPEPRSPPPRTRAFGQPRNHTPQRPAVVDGGEPPGADQVACRACGHVDERGYSYCARCLAGLPGGKADVADVVSPYRRRSP